VSEAESLVSEGAWKFITRWDLDKTYLRTDFDSFKDLVDTALEGAEQKRTVPGATAVLRALSGAGARVHILSGSPRQMRGKLEAKLRLDGVSWDVLTLKPNLSNLLRLRLRALRDQLGYKLPELLEARAAEIEQFPQALSRPEVLVGDDSESDALVYSLYADLCAGVVSSRELEDILRAGEVRPSVAARCLRTLLRIQVSDTVACILIHLDRQTPPSLFTLYGPRLVPFYNYLQAGLVLLERGFLDARVALTIADEFLGTHGFSADAVARSYLDLQRRGHASGRAPELLLRAVEEAPGSLHPDLSAAFQSMRDGATLPTNSVPPTGPPDYGKLAAAHRSGSNRRVPGQRFG